MPWLDDLPPLDLSEWRIVFKNSLKRRLPAHQLKTHLRTLSTKYPTTPGALAKVLLSFRSSEVGADDPLLFHYAQLILCERLTTSAHILHALLRTSRFTKPAATSTDHFNGTGLPTCEERIFNMLTQMYISGSLDLRPTDIHDTVQVLTTWLRSVSSYELSKQLNAEVLHTISALMFATYEALASLTITIFGAQVFREAARHAWWKKRREVVVSEMLNFDSQVLLWINSSLGGRLQAMTSIPPFIRTDDRGRPVFSNEQVLNSVPDLPIENTRAGLFVWLNACLCGRPLTDDMSMLTNLQARFGNNNQSLAVDLLIAAFDILTNALLRHESGHHIHVVQSFICNKVPHLLSIVSGFMPNTMAIEACISLAFMAITMNPLPPISTGATSLTEKLKLTRLECLQACALHGLVTENTISSILQEPPLSLPRVTKYTKEGLTSQCANNVGRLEPLIDELDSMLGNAGAIAGCIVDMLSSLCMNKDTMSLKSVCNMLVKKTALLDIVMQYTQPVNLLLPLCNQLNNWTQDQDQTEFTPAYEEFAAILLFVLAAVHRYDLQPADLGLLSSENFIGRLLTGAAVSKSPNDLSEEQRQQLGKWIEGLFATDESGEIGGISDEVMRHCPPQAFYQLVPTLFDQMVLARKSGALTVKTFNGGLELLVEPFLLPSLVGGLNWLIQHSWEDHGDANILVQLLDKLLKPSSSSQETKAMHRAILGMIANPLYQSLQILSQRQPDKKQVGPLMGHLKGFLNQRKSMEANKAEAEDWSNPEKGGLPGRVRLCIRELVTWATDVGPSPPPRYTHRLFTHSCAVIGANSVRDAIAAELNDQTAAGNGSAAIDICTSIVCTSPSSLQAPGATSLRDALRLQTGDLQSMLEHDAGEAEAVVRLSRRVEAQLAVHPMAQLSMAMPLLPAQAADHVMAELGLADDSLTGANTADVSTHMDITNALDTSAAVDFSNNAELNSAIDQAINADAATRDLASMVADSTTMGGAVDNIFGDLGLDMTQAPYQMLDAGDNGMNLTMDGQQNNDDDIFAGLDMNNLGEDFNFS